MLLNIDGCQCSAILPLTAALEQARSPSSESPKWIEKERRTERRCHHDAFPSAMYLPEYVPLRAFRQFALQADIDNRSRANVQ